MKKITLLLLALVAFQFNYAQDTCLNAVTVTAGNTTVLGITGTEIPDPICAENGVGATLGNWYVYSAAISGVVNVATNIASNPVATVDTRLHVYTGTCGALTCVGGNDDVDYGAGDYRSEFSFNVVSGTDYYIAFDDRWSAGGFDFEITETVLSCLPPNGFNIGPLGITATSFDVTWVNDNGPGTVFDIEFGPAGFVLGTGTTVNDIATSSYNFTGLTADTEYEFYITANCTGGNGDSDQVGPIAFVTAFECSTYGLPYNENFDSANAFASCFATEDVDGDTLSWISQQDLDFDGDMINETFATNASGDPADFSNGGLKDDWLFSPAISLTGGTEYQLSSSYNVLQGTANASLEAFILDAPSSTANVVATLFSDAGFTTNPGANPEAVAYLQTNTFTPSTSGDYYVAYRSFGPRGGGFLLLFNSTLESTLSVDQFDANNFSYSYNKNTDQLTLESSNLPFDSIRMHSILGKEVVSRELSNQNEIIDISSLTDGIYLATISINGNSKTIKVLKH